MSKQGTYNVSGDRRRDTSFQSFICALLVFLFLCLVIYLALMLTSLGRNDKDSKAEVLKKSEDKSVNDKLVVVNVPNNAKGKDVTTERIPKILTTLMRKTTQRYRTTTVTYHEEENTIPQYEIEEPEETSTTKRLYSKITERTTIGGNTEEESTTPDAKKDHVNWEEQRKTSEQLLSETTDNVQPYQTTESLTDELTTKDVDTDLGIDHEIFHIRSSSTEGSQTSVDHPTTEENDDANNRQQNLQSSTGSTTSSNLYSTSLTPSQKSSFTPGDAWESTTESFQSSSTDTGLLDKQITSDKDAVEVFTSATDSTPISGLTENETQIFTTENESTDNFDSTTQVVTQFHVLAGADTTNLDSTTEVVMQLPILIVGRTGIDTGTENSLSTNSFDSTTEAVTRSPILIVGQTDIKTTAEPSTQDSMITNNFVSTTQSPILVVSQADTETTESYTDDIDSTTQFATRSHILTNQLNNDTTKSSTESDEVTDNFSSTTEVLTRFVNLTGRRLVSKTTEEDLWTSELSSTEGYGSSTTVDIDTMSYASETTETTKLYSTASTAIAGMTTPALPNKECISVACKEATSTMLHLMDHAADPCQDFYKFACGGRTDEDVSKENNFKMLLDYVKSVNGSSEKYLQDFSIFYESCVEHEREFGFSKKIQFVKDVANYSRFTDLTQLFIELILTQSMPLLDIGIDIGGNQEYKFQLTLPGRSPFKVGVKGWSLTDQIKRHCLNEQKFQYSTERLVDLGDSNLQYKNCQKRRLNDTARNFIQDIDPYIQDRYSSIYSDDNVERLILFLEKIKSLMPRDFEIQDQHMNRAYVSSSIRILNEKYGIVDWKTFFESLTFNSTFSEDDYVDVYFPSYMDAVFQMLNSTYSQSELMAVLNLYSHLQLYENTVIPRDRDSPELHCMDLARELMPDIVSTIVYELARGQNMHIQYMRIFALFQKLRGELQDSLMNSRLDDKSKNKLSQKLSRVKLGMITTGNYNVTRGHYQNVSVTEGEFQENVLQLLRNYRSMVYSLEGLNASAANLLIYFVDPFNSRPVSFYPSEYIVFHPAVFQGHSMELPEYVRLSKVGLHLGTELAKHLDLIGRKFFTDQDIRLSNDYYSNLEDQTLSLLVSYANNTYEVDEKMYLFQTQPRLLVNEMIVDSAALRLIYDSFRMLKNQIKLPWVSDSYPMKKTFYILAAQEFCRKTTASNFMVDLYEAYRLPSPLKIQNMVSNSVEFSNIFQCSNTSAMYIDEIIMAQFPHINYIEEYDYSDSLIDPGKLSN